MLRACAPLVLRLLPAAPGPTPHRDARTTTPPGPLALEGGAAAAGTRFPDAAPALRLPRRIVISVTL